MPFDGPQSSPDDVIYGARQLLKVINKELLWVFSVLRQWLHHAQHLAHVGFRLLENAFQSITVKLTTRFKQITWCGQASELNDIKGFGFMMNIA